jgi:hypothetical protein
VKESRYIVKESQEGGDMGTIASLLFGRDAGRLLDLISGDGEREAADRLARSREWCGSTPGHGRAPRPTSGEDRSPRSPFPFGRFDVRLTRYVRGMSGALRGMPQADPGDPGDNSVV